MSYPSDQYRPTEQYPVQPTWADLSDKTEAEPSQVSEPSALSRVLYDRNKFAWGVALTALTAGLAAWLVSWVVAIIVGKITNSPEHTPEGAVIAIVAAILTVLTATLMLVLAAYAPRPRLFFYCLTGIVAALIVFGPLKVNGISPNTIAQAVVNLVLFVSVVALLIAVTRSTFNFDGDHRAVSSSGYVRGEGW